MSAQVFIDGAAGTTGLEIRDRLSRRPEFDLVVLGEADRKDPQARAQALNAADFVILCLPDDAAREALALVASPDTRIIDASTAFRTAPDWTYGFAELAPGQRQAIAGATRVSNPGCYPTGFLALVRPLVAAGLIPADWPVSVHAVSGYSGGGKSMIAAFDDPAAPDAADTAFRAYGLSLAHKHVGEMQVHAGLRHPPIFSPAVARTYRGMVVEVPLSLYALPGAPSLAACEEALREAYRGSRLVQVASATDTAIDIEENAGRDIMTLRVHGNTNSGQARLIATLDNLGKGASGAAVQNLNIMAGVNETTGLRV